MSEQTPNDGDTVSDPRLRDSVPGIAVLTVCAIFSWIAALIVPAVSALQVAILVGFLLANVVGLPAWARQGVGTHKVFLGAAIVLIGGSMTIADVFETGPIVLLTVISVTTLTLVTVEVFSRNLFGIDDKLASLLAAGSGICGVSAIVAVGGSIRAREEHVVYAVATILLFDAVTLVVYPVIGRLLAIPDKVFGVWAGVSMFSTGPVVAVGFAYSETAGQWATLTKLTRNTLLGLIAVGYAAYYARRRLDGTNERGARLRELWDRFPKFVVGFFVLMLLASAGILVPGHAQAIKHAYNWLFLLAFVGLGTELHLSKLRRAGLSPIAVVFATLCLVSVLSLLVLSIVLS